MKRKTNLVLSIVIIIFIALFTLNVNLYASETKKPYHIEIYTFKVGTFTYALGVALADFINKESTWLKATAIEAASPSITGRIIAEEPVTRKKIIGFITRWELETAYPPNKVAYHGLRDIAVIGFVTNGFVTLDPKIKTVKDLSGKRVGLGTSPSAARVDMPKQAILNAGVKNVKFSEHGFVDGVRALSDGLIDTLLSATVMRDATNKKFVPNPALGKLMATKKISFVSFDKAAYDIARKELSIKSLPTWYSYSIPSGGVKGQTNPWIIQGGPINWVCDISMPEEVIYEVVRIMSKNADKFKDYHPLGKIISPKNMAKLGNESKVHLGALKYYKEKGIEIGSF